MGTKFDPYYDWLGIAPKHQPPHHYRLLGLELFEENESAIENAADRQMAHVRTAQTGDHKEDAQRLLNQISAARVCLLDPTTKQAYDDRIRRALAKRQAQQSAKLKKAKALPAEETSSQPASPAKARSSNAASPSAAGDSSGAPVEEVATAANSSEPASGDMPGIAAAQTSVAKIASRRASRNRGGLWIILSVGLVLAIAAGTGAFLFMQKGEPTPVANADPLDENGSPKTPAATDGTDPSDATPPKTPVDPAGTEAPSTLPSTVPSTAPSTVPADPNTPSLPGASPADPVPLPTDPNGIPGGGLVNQPVDPVAAPATGIPPVGGNQPAAGDPAGGTEPPPTDPPSGSSPPATGDPEATEPATVAAERLPVPEKEVRDAKRTQIAAIFPTENAKTAEDRLELARQLLKTGRETPSDPPAQFVLYNLSRELAIEAGDAPLAFEAINTLAARFDFDADSLRVAALEQASKASVPNEAKREIIPTGNELVARLADEDEFDKAVALLTRLQGIARDLRDRDAQKQLSDYRKEVTERQEKFAVVKAALQTLTQQPADPEANLVAGRYFTFVRGDWERGLPMLAQGSDDELRKLAESELAQPASGVAQAVLAGAWWMAAEKQEDSELAALFRVRAGQWYRKAQPSLSGIVGLAAKTRLDELAASGVHLPEMSAGSLKLAMFASSSESGGASQSAGKVSRTKGTLYLLGDEFMDVRLNGEEIASQVRNRPVKSLPVELKLGDLITTHTSNTAYGRFVGMAFVSDDKTRTFFTNLGTWRAYTPDDPARWWEVKPADTHARPRLGHFQYFDFSAVANGSGTLPIWGIDDQESYIYHVVDENDLLEVREVDYPKIRRSKTAVAGTLYVGGNDHCDVVINGLPIVSSNRVSKSVTVELRQGDVICAQVANTSYGSGFMLVFKSTDGMVHFGTNQRTWGVYQPLDAQRWHLFDPRVQWPTVGTGKPKDDNNGDLVATTMTFGPALGVQSIWGPKNVGVWHLFHVVDELDMKPLKK